MVICSKFESGTLENKDLFCILKIFLQLANKNRYLPFFRRWLLLIFVGTDFQGFSRVFNRRILWSRLLVSYTGIVKRDFGL